jgi:hypothetical protein
MKFLHILATWFALILTGAAQSIVITEGPKVETSGTRATIRWKTSSECGTRVRYGLSPDKLDNKAGEGTGIDHLAVLDNLTADTTYHFSVGTSRYDLAKGSFKAGAKQVPVSAEKKPAATPAAKPPLKAPPTRQTWGHLPSLADHFERHGKDFAATSQDDYARKAWEFLQRAIDEGLPAKYDDSDGTIRVWESKSHSFGAYNKNFTTKTYFKPESPTYFERQPGKPVRLKRTAEK